MTSWRVIAHRVLAGLATRRRDEELREEIDAHLDALAGHYLREGMSVAEARAAARRQFGGVEQTKEAYRAERGLPFLDALRQDLRFSTRTFIKSPGLTLVVIVTLALGIGANTATFSVLNAVMLRPLPVPHPEQLFVLESPTPTAVPQRLSYPMFERLRAVTSEATPVAATSRVATMFAAVAGPELERVAVQLVSGEYFSVLGVGPSIGRLLTPADNRTVGGHPVAVASEGWWRRRFGGTPDIVGRTLTVNGTSFTIVGVAGAGFAGTWADAAADLWIPAMMQHEARYAQNFSSHNGDDRKPFVPQEDIEWLQVFGRSAPADSATIGAALKLAYQQGLAHQAAPYAQDSPTRAFFLQQRITLDSFARGASIQRQRLTTPLLVLLVMVALVLLIACANSANLLLARASARQREIAIRLAMGASRSRLIRQLLTESTLVAIVATGTGLVIARSSAIELMREMTRNGTGAVPSLLDIRVLAFTTLVSTLTALLFGLWPALHTVDLGAADQLRVDTRTMAAGRGSMARHGLVAAQVALSLVLVVGATLCAESLRFLSQVDLGFDADHVLSVVMNTRAGRYDERDLPALHARLIERVTALPGVRSAAVSECQLVSGCRNSSTVQIDGYLPRAGERLQIAESHVGVNYFSTVGMRLTAGRDFDPRDRAPCERTGPGCDLDAKAIVNAAMVRRFFAGREAIGQRFRYGSQHIEIVGLVEDARASAVQEPPVPMAYYPLKDSNVHASVLEVATIRNPALSAADVRRAILDAEPNLPVSSVRTLAEQVSRGIEQERFVAALTGAFGVLALGLASFGLFGVMSYGVARRTPELGVRLALGARRRSIVWMVFKESLVVVAAGVAAGLPLVLAGSRLISGWLVGIAGVDPAALAGGGAVLLAAAGLAGFFPAWRASSVDPIVALRHE